MPPKSPTDVGKKHIYSGENSVAIHDQGEHEDLEEEVEEQDDKADEDDVVVFIIIIIIILIIIIITEINN